MKYDPDEILAEIKKDFEAVVKDRGHHAVLDESGNVIPATFLQWAAWFERGGQRIIEQDDMFGFFVSTVFLGLNHQYDQGPPLWFETMIFDRWHGRYNLITDHPVPDDLYLERYTTRQEAIAGHARAKRWLETQPFYYPLALPYGRRSNEQSFQDIREADSGREI